MLCRRLCLLVFKDSRKQEENPLLVLSDASGFSSCHCSKAYFFGALWNDQVDYLL
jgi:hypothetical protein